MPAGRPRISTPDEEEVKELGESLVKWAEEESKELRCRFCEWYTLPENGFIRKDWDALIRLNQFRPYYERAQAALGRRYMDGTINPSVGHRVMWHFVPESKEQEIDRMTKEAEIKKKAFEEGTQDLSDFKAWMNEKTKTKL